MSDAHQDLLEILKLIQQRKDVISSLRKTDPELYEAVKNWSLAVLDLCEKVS